MNQGLIHPRLTEIEVGQAAVNREAFGSHLVADGADRTIRGFCFDQLLDQPRLNAQELPISAEIDSMEQIAVPFWRSAVKVTFPVRDGRGALLKIVLEDDEAAPAGAVVRIEGDNREFYVARRGEAFVTGLQTRNRVLLRWNDRQCVFDVTLPPPAQDEIPRLGPLLCKGVVR